MGDFGPSPFEMWTQLKARGGATIAEIDTIDNATPWRATEPAWWLEMMKERMRLLAAQRQEGDNG